MQTVTVIAREKFPYAGIDRAVGETFDATVEDAKLLSLIGKVDLPGRECPNSEGPLGVEGSNVEEAWIDPPKRRTRRRSHDTATE